MANWFEEFERSFDEMFKGLELPKELVREKKLPDGATVREMGPFVYGYSFSVGPDGKPVIREFGNVKPSIGGGPFGAPKPKLSVKDEREPLVDAIVHDDIVKVVAELPGVEKSDITLHSTVGRSSSRWTTRRGDITRSWNFPWRSTPTHRKPITRTAYWNWS